MALSPKEMNAAILANLKEKTGKSSSQWLALAKASGIRESASLTRWFKAEHALGHVTAQVLARLATTETTAYDDEDALLNALFASGTHAAALFGVLEKIVQKAAPDAERVACKTYVGFRLGKQFAAARPSDSGKALELAVALKGVATDLEPTKFRAGGAMTHGTVLRTKAQVQAVGKAIALAAHASQEKA
jgi:hypothetical protein